MCFVSLVWKFRNLIRYNTEIKKCNLRWLSSRDQEVWRGEGNFCMSWTSSSLSVNRLTISLQLLLKLSWFRQNPLLKVAIFPLLQSITPGSFLLHVSTSFARRGCIFVPWSLLGMGRHSQERSLAWLRQVYDPSAGVVSGTTVSTLLGDTGSQPPVLAQPPALQAPLSPEDPRSAELIWGCFASLMA